MSASITIRPWPGYSDTGNGPIWDLRVESAKFRGTLQWSEPLRRFTNSKETYRLMSQDMASYRAALRLIVEFCSKNKQKVEEVAWHPV